MKSPKETLQNSVGPELVAGSRQSNQGLRQAQSERLGVLHRFPQKNQAGFTLIEVLVAVLIFSVALLGLVGLQTRGMQFAGDADGTNNAALLANEAANQMFILEALNFPVTAAAEYAAWVAKVQDPANGLPNGNGVVVFTPRAGAIPDRATITVSWQNASDPQPRTYTTQISGNGGVPRIANP